MNLFLIDLLIESSVKSLCDKHVVKMPTESMQMISTITNHLGFDSPYKPVMLNHPSTIWARKSMHNTKWLYEHGLALCEEFTHRYGKIHGSEARIKDLDDFYIESASWDKATPVDIAMFDKYRIPNDMEVHNWDYVIRSYRHYYLEGKWRFASWRKNRRPEWYPENWYAVQFNKEVRGFNERNGGNLKLMEE